MKFIRREDLNASTRSTIAILALFCQGIYGARTAIAQQYNISRTFLYQMMAVATLCLHQLFSEYKDIDLPLNRLNLTLGQI